MPSEQERLQKIVDRATAKRLYNQARRKFKAGTRDRLSFVFVDENGERIKRGSRKKAYALYIDKNGKKKSIPTVIRKTDESGKRHKTISYTPKKKSTWTLQHTKKKTALQKLYTRNVVLETESVKRKKGARTASYLQFADTMSRYMKRLMDDRWPERGVFQVDVSAIIRIDGKLKTFTARLDWRGKAKQTITLDQLNKFFQTKCYHFLAQVLSENGLVSRGSFNYVKALPDNEGLDVDEWVNSHGDPWEGSDKEVVTVEQFDFEIAQAQLVK